MNLLLCSVLVLFPIVLHCQELVPGQLLQCNYTDVHNMSCVFNDSGQYIIYELELEENLNYVVGSSSWWVTLVVCIILVLCAGLMSGMTIGLMSLDLMNLKILKESGTETERKYCKKIIPLVSHHHLLLVTLLLANAAAMESLPIFLDLLVPSYLAIILSVTMILFFGEVIPQAICSRYGLAIGYYIHWFMWALIGVCFIVAYPVGKLLDCILGDHQLTFYRVAELKQLVELHKLADQKRSGEGPSLTEDEVRIIKSALSMREKVCDETVYTPLEKVWALPSTTILDHDTIDKIHSTGHSRIPVYRKKINHIIGLILVKDLITVNPADKVPLEEIDLVMIPQVTSNTPLYDLLNHFRKGKSHMALVLDNEDFTSVLGVITLEDIIEELLAVEILDEQDLRANRDSVPRPAIEFSPHNLIMPIKAIDQKKAPPKKKEKEKEKP